MNDNMMREEDKGICLHDKLLLLGSKKLASKYKGKKLVPVTSINSVGIMTAPVYLLKDKISIPGYLVYTIDEDGELQKFGVTHLRFSIALCVARQFYISLCVANSLTNSKENVKKEPSHSDFIKAYSEMSKKYRDEDEKYTRIRRRDR